MAGSVRKPIKIFALLFLLFLSLPVFAAEKAEISKVTLITGDGITAYNISGKITYSILPEKGGSRNYQIIESPKGTYFIPDDVDLKKVDLELFNIEYLLKEGYAI